MPTDFDATLADQQSIDKVIVCDDESETAHNLKGSNMNFDKNVGWRDAYNGWISYDLKVDPNHPCELVLKHWGGDGGNR